MSLRFGKVMEQHDALQLNALQLAYLGDSVWELIVRYNLIMQKFNVHHMHKDCVNLVNAHSQAVILQKIQNELDETETEIIRRGRNAHAKHSAPRNQDPDEYAASTGFEAPTNSTTPTPLPTYSLPSPPRCTTCCRKPWAGCCARQANAMRSVSRHTSPRGTSACPAQCYVTP